MSNTIQSIQVKPEQLQNSIIAGVKEQLDQFKESFQRKGPTEYLIRNEVKELLHIDLSTVHNRTKINKRKAYGIGNRIYYKRNAVEQAIKPLNNLVDTTTNVNVVRHIYKLERAKKLYSVYQLTDPNKKRFFTEFIMIELFRGYSKAIGFKDYFRIKDTNNWQKSKLITGVKPTSYTNIFYGDYLEKGKKSLIVFKFSTDKKSLIVDYYTNYYPTKVCLNTFINKYK